MIDEFTKYVSHYGFDDYAIKGKYDHSLRVMEYAIKFAKLLGFSEEDIELARVIGLLHDFGRFEQWKLYKTFSDLNSIDHADYSVEQLFKKGEIKGYCQKEELYPIIEFAIKNHNKLKVPIVDDERMMKHAFLIRDADKTDIMTLLCDGLKERPDNSIINADIKRIIKEHRAVDKKYVKTNNDNIAVIYAYAFDLHYDIVLDDFKKIFMRFHEIMDGGVEFDEIFKEVIDYLDERIYKYEKRN